MIPQILVRQKGEHTHSTNLPFSHSIHTMHTEFQTVNFTPRYIFTYYNYEYHKPEMYYVLKKLLYNFFHFLRNENVIIIYHN